jgi:gamma-glutamylcyclotransferase (GGCT)/AIG2-like uncharacterized protein YtfP
VAGPANALRRVVASPETDAGAPAGVFVYGTLTDPARRLRVLRRSPALVPALLQNYERRNGRYPYLLPAEGREVRGWILLNIEEADLARLDDYEVAIPKSCAGSVRRLYRRELVDVMTVGGRRVRCWVYMPNLADWPRRWK